MFPVQDMMPKSLPMTATPCVLIGQSLTLETIFKVMVMALLLLLAILRSQDSTKPTQETSTLDKCFWHQPWQRADAVHKCLKKVSTLSKFRCPIQAFVTHLKCPSNGVISPMKLTMILALCCQVGRKNCTAICVWMTDKICTNLNLRFGDAP